MFNAEFINVRCIWTYGHRNMSTHWFKYLCRTAYSWKFIFYCSINTLSSAIFVEEVLRNFTVSDEVINFIAKWNYLVDFLKQLTVNLFSCRWTQPPTPQLTPLLKQKGKIFLELSLSLLAINCATRSLSAFIWISQARNNWKILQDTGKKKFWFIC